MKTSSTLGALVVLIFVQGCALTPRGLKAEEASLRTAGAAFRRAPTHNELPAPVDGDDWRALLRRALIANGDVRAAWFDWKAAVGKVSGASSWPNSNISLGYSYMFSDSSVKAFDRMSFDAGLDQMENLSYPGKTMAAGRVALAEANAAGERFRAAKFSVQRQVLEAWLDLALAAENARLAREEISLAGIGSDAAEAAVETGADQGAALGAQITAARSEDAVAVALARLGEAGSVLRGLCFLDKVEIPSRLPRPRALPADPALLLAATRDGPEVKGLQADRRTRVHEEDLAELQWIPDINPSAAITGSIEQGVGAMIMLPTTIIEIRSGIAVAQAMRRAASARLAQSRRDQLAMAQAALIAAADSGRARRLLEERILPAAVSASIAAESGYTTGRSQLGVLVDTRTLLVEVRREIAATAIQRERDLALLEELLGADLETFTDRPAVLLASRDETSTARGAQTSELPR